MKQRYQLDMNKFTNPLIQNHAKNTANHGVARLYWLVQLKGESAKGNDMMNKSNF